MDTIAEYPLSLHDIIVNVLISDFYIALFSDIN